MPFLPLLAMGVALSVIEGHAQVVAVREIASTMGAPESPLGSIADMLAIGDGRVLISDDVNRALYVWHTDSDTVSELAGTGEGPGEVKLPTRLAKRPQGGFAVYDIGASAVKFFDHNGLPDGSVIIRGIVSNPKSLALWTDGSILLSGGRLLDPRHLHRFTSSGAWLEAYGLPSRQLMSNYTKIQTAGGVLYPTSDSEMLFSFGAPLRIVKLSDGELAHADTLLEDPETLGELQEEAIYVSSDRYPGARTFLWWHDRTTGVFVRPDGGLLNVVTRFYTGESEWLFYSSAGQPEARLVLDRAYFAFHDTGDGLILASRRDPTTDEHIATMLAVTSTYDDDSDAAEQTPVFATHGRRP